ncbi:uncharacterized protein FTOL_09950 [Fusarium torulosum]|uniref:Uncharacterized protein n=1 Tax=Fusarium torulosum TaxID=33205 RepID=A0AAE8MGI1_9HYPO|nr:uncharacterized protein FTOL_09950 [Fusarium torulosum]
MSNGPRDDDGGGKDLQKQGLGAHLPMGAQVFHADETCRGVVGLLWYDPSFESFAAKAIEESLTKMLYQKN